MQKCARFKLSMNTEAPEVSAVSAYASRSDASRSVEIMKANAVTFRSRTPLIDL